MTQPSWHFQTAGMDQVSADIMSMFESMVNADRLSSEADKAIGASIRSRYGSKATWRAERWFVPVPSLHYDGRETPQLVINVTIYLVSAALVRMVQDSRLVTIVGALGKPETLAVPMIFLHALLVKDPGRFTIIARDTDHTTWEVPGARPVRIPNEFMSKLIDALKWQSVVVWLAEFGAQGKVIAPLVAGSLFGLAFQDSVQPVLLSKEVMTTDALISALESMAFQPAEAREMMRNAAPRLRADMTLEDAIRVTLQMGKEGDKS